MSALVRVFGVPQSWARIVPGAAITALMGLGVTLLAVPPAVGGPAHGQVEAAAETAPPQDEEPLTAPDAVSAATIARLEGEPVEILGERTESGSVYALPDGSRAAGLGAGPVWVRQGGDGTNAEDWAPVDLTLEVGDDGLVRPVAQSAGLVLSGGTTAAEAAAAAAAAASVEVEQTARTVTPPGPEAPAATPSPSVAADAASTPQPSSTPDATPTPTPTSEVTPGPSSSQPAPAPSPAEEPATRTLIASVTDPATGVVTRVQWDGTLPQPRLEGRRATYKGVEPGIDLVLEATSTGFQQFFVVHERPAADAELSFPLTVSTDGVPVTVGQDGSLSVQTPAGEAVGRAGVPYMWDAHSDVGRPYPVTQPRPAETPEPGLPPMPDFSTPRAPSEPDESPATEEQIPAPEVVGDVRIDPLAEAVEIERDVRVVAADEVAVDLVPSQEFLQDPATQYPVVVDPAYDIFNGFDTYVLKGFGNDRSQETELRIGTYNGGTNVARSFIHFPTANFANKVVHEAWLNLYNFQSWSCSPRAWTVHASGPASPATTWANQPAQGLYQYALTDQTLGYGECASGYSSVDVTKLAKDWAAQGLAEGYVTVRAANEADNFAYKRFFSANNGGFIPGIWVKYNDAPNPPENVRVSPSPNDTANYNYVNSTTPKFSATISDPDGGTVGARFRVQRADTGAVVWETSVANQPNGYVISAEIQAGKLTAGPLYAVSVWSTDPDVEGPGVGPRYFSIDTSAPSAPYVTSTDFRPTGWENKNANETGNVTLSMPSADGSVTGYVWGLDKAPSTFIVGMGGQPATLPITPTTPGKHELQVRSVDRAGNYSSQITKYTFNVGQAGITSPVEGSQVVRRVRLHFDSKPGFDEVSFQWRRGPDVPEGDAKPIAATFLTTSTGDAWTAEEHPTSALTYTTWDVGRMLGFEPGPIQVRAKLTRTATSTTPSATAATQWVTLTVDPDADGAATADVGAGSVNLLTGDHALTATDASEFGLSVVRSSSSRDTDSGYQLQADKLTPAQQQMTALTGITGGNATVAVATNRFHSGKESLKITPTGASGDTFASIGGDSQGMRLDLKAGKTYRFSGWVHVPAATDTTVPTGATTRALRMLLFTGTGNGQYSEPSLNGNATASPRVVNAWQKVSFDATIPPGSTEAFLRLYNGFTAASGQVVYWDDVSVREIWAPFGPQWALGTADHATGTAYTRVSRPYPDVAAVHLTGGGEVWFSSVNGEKWWPQPGAEDLTLTSTSPTTWRLTELDGTVTDFTQNAQTKDFPVSSSTPPGAPGTGTPTTRYSYTPVDGVSRLTRIIAPVQDGVNGGPGSATACTTTPLAIGCQALDLTYYTASQAGSTQGTFGSYTGRVATVSATAYDPAAGAMKSVPVAQYAYDNLGRLREVYDPRIGTDAASRLVTRYTYTAAGQVQKMTPPGQETVTFTHGTAGGARSLNSGDLIDANPGRLLELSRPSLDPANPTNTTRVVYDVPLTRDRGGPYDLGPAQLATWAQSDGPTDATALFGPDQPAPVPNTATTTSPGVDGYDRAEVHYLNASGKEVNTASPKGKTTPVEGFIDTTEYDQYGNVIRTLDATNRLLALRKLPGGDAALSAWGVSLQTPPDVLATQLDSRTVYTTDGLDVLAQIGPMQRLALGNNADTTALLRPVTLNRYDETKPAGGAVFHLVTTTITGAVTMDAPTVPSGPLAGTYDQAALNDPLVTSYGYNPDGADALGGASGWIHKQPTQVTVDPAGKNAITKTTYDDRGRPIKTVPPGADGSHPATTLTDYYTAEDHPTRNVECGNKPAWAGKPCTTRAAAAITGHDPTRMGSELPVRHVTAYNHLGAPTTVTEKVAGLTRTTTTTYDAANRTTAVDITGEVGVGESLPKVTTTYNPGNGQVATTATTAGTIAREYDTLGRLTKYTDASGAWTTTTYDRYGKPTKVTTSLGATTTYTYDRTLEPRGLVTAITDSVAGTITPTWGPDGQLESQQLPGGVTMTLTYDAARVPTARSYTVPGQTVPLQADSVIENNRGQWVRHTTIALGGQLGTQDYTYDNLGRLTDVKDANPAASTCTWRTYAFDARGSRTDQRTTVDPWTPATPGQPATTTGCTRNPTTTPQGATGFSSVHTNNDTGDRLVSTDTSGGNTWMYDAFGRVTTFPNADAAGTVTNTFYANDLIAEQTTGTTSVSWALDPLQRRMTYTRQDGTAAAVNKTSYYGDDTDNPAWIKEGTAPDAPVTRYLGGADGQAVMSTTKTGGQKLLLTDLHGDVVTTVPLVDGAGIDTPSIRHHTYDEFGNARALGRTPASPGRYGWLGARERSGEALGDVTLMGVRLYAAVIGRFLSVDPVPGGNTTAYNYPQDPINQLDVDGKKSSTKSWKTRAKDAWKAVRRWAGAKKGYRGWNGVNVSRGLGITSAVTGVVAAGFMLSGGGAPVGVALGAVSMGTGIASTAIGCTAAWDAWCWLGIGTTALGAFGSAAKAAKPILGLDDWSVNNANALGNFLGGTGGGAGTGASWFTSKMGW